MGTPAGRTQAEFIWSGFDLPVSERQIAKVRGSILEAQRNAAVVVEERRETSIKWRVECDA